MSTRIDICRHVYILFIKNQSGWNAQLASLKNAVVALRDLDSIFSKNHTFKPMVLVMVR